MLNRQKGFTLIELLIVIAIILILIAIALPNFLEAQLRAKVTKAAGEIRSLGIAQASYQVDWNTFTNDCTGSDNVPPRQGCFQLTTPIAYITEIPQDPFGAGLRESGVILPLNGVYISYYPMATGVNPSTFQKRYSTGGAGPQFTRANLGYAECFLIFSAGPSDQEPGNPTSTFPMEADIEPGSNQGWIVYSPTNGSKSFGGIIRTGGAALELPQLWHLNAETHN